MAQSLIVSIGRSVGMDDELSSSAWYAFRTALRTEAGKVGTVVFTGEGVGLWGEQVEEACTVIVAVQEPLFLSKLYTALDRLREEYLQESIAVTVGDTVFVGQEA